MHDLQRLIRIMYEMVFYGHNDYGDKPIVQV